MYEMNYSLICYVFLPDQSLYLIKHLPETYRLLLLEYMRVVKILSFERYNQIFSNSIRPFSFLQLQFSLLTQFSYNTHIGYEPTGLTVHPPPE